MNKHFNKRQQLVIDHWAGDAKSTAAACGLTEKTVRNILRSFWVWNAIAYPKDPLADLRLAEKHWREQFQDPAITGCHRNAAIREYFKAAERLARAEGWMPHGNARPAGKKGKAFLASIGKESAAVDAAPVAPVSDLTERVAELTGKKKEHRAPAPVEPPSPPATQQRVEKTEEEQSSGGHLTA